MKAERRYRLHQHGEGVCEMTKKEFLAIMKSYLTSDLSDSTYYSIDYWHPLQSIKPDIPVVVFDLWKIYDDNNAIKQLEKVLSNLSIDIVTAIQNQDFNNEPKTVNLKTLLYEADKDGYNFPWYVESYYYDNSKQWMIYTSHEFTITFAGEEIVRVANEIIDPKYLIKYK